MKKNPVSLLACTLLLTMSVNLLSCSKNETLVETPKVEMSTTPKVENGMLVFPDHPSFLSFISKLESEPTTVMPVFSSLFEEFTESSKLDEDNDAIKDLLDFGFPPSYQKVLNQEGKVKIGNEVILYSHGKKYFIPESEAKKDVLTSMANVKSLDVGKNIIKLDLSINGINQPLSTTFYGASNEGERLMSGTKNTISYVDLGLNSLDARHQREFWCYAPVGTGWRKMVHEVVTFFDGYWMGNAYVYQAMAGLRIKMYWDNNKKRNWRPASEMREIVYNIYGSATAMNFSFGSYEYGPSFNLSGSANSNGEHWINLAKRGGSGSMTNPYWRIELSGSIYHNVIGDAAGNGWNNVGYPLW